MAAVADEHAGLAMREPPAMSRMGKHAAWLLALAIAGTLAVSQTYAWAYGREAVSFADRKVLPDLGEVLRHAFFALACIAGLLVVGVPLIKLVAAGPDRRRTATGLWFLSTGVWSPVVLTAIGRPDHVSLPEPEGALFFAVFWTLASLFNILAGIVGSVAWLLLSRVIEYPRR